MRKLFSLVNLKVLAPLLVIQLFLFGLVYSTALTSRKTTSSHAADVSCPPNSESQGTWCDYRHTTNENDPNAPVLNPNYLDTYNDCWGKCHKVEFSQCNPCHFKSSNNKVCAQKGAWAGNDAQCSFICNWACCGGEETVSACTGGPVAPTATTAPKQPTQPIQPTTPPYIPPVQPTSAPRITIVLPTAVPPTSVPLGSIDFQNANGQEVTTEPTVAPGKLGDPLSGVSNFFGGVWARIVFEAKLNSKRVVYFSQSVWYILAKPFEHP